MKPRAIVAVAVAVCVAAAITWMLFAVLPRWYAEPAPVLAEITGPKSAHSAICLRIFASHASPPTSSAWSNHTSTPAARSASAICLAASASCEA